MRGNTFRGGVHPPYNKAVTAGRAIARAQPPSMVVIPLSQHTGAPCSPLVNPGDRVKLGQKIGDSEAFVSAPVHASVSGKVVAVEDRLHPALGRRVRSVVLESDGLDEIWEGVAPRPDFWEIGVDEARKAIREAGIVGLGGAAFPTAVKISPPKDKPVDSYLLNGCECEPYLTADHRLMVERAEDAVYGMLALMYGCGVKRGFVCIEDNKPDAVAAMKKALSTLAQLAGSLGAQVSVVVLHTKYPQGSEKHLIKAVLGREVPPGGLPFDVGAMVSNVGTAVAVADAFKKGMPLIERVVTVTGAVGSPSNLLVRVGAPLEDVIRQAGGFRGTPGKVIMGGPMMGIAQRSLDVPVIKGTSGILVLRREELPDTEPSSCIRCARCVAACPMGLLPLFLGAYAERGQLGKAEEFNALDCIECGCCSYVCPARRPLVHAIRVAKADIMERRRRIAQASRPPAGQSGPQPKADVKPESGNPGLKAAVGGGS